MNLKLSNTLTGKVEKFVPINNGKVTIYCCGVTVYDLCHLGHARSYISWDVLRRYIIWNGLEVKFVQNFTDIDDKIINKAKNENLSMSEISDRSIKDYHTDMKRLGILSPDRMPCATDYINEIKTFIQELEKKDAAYPIDGDVYFSVKKYSNYGKLSGRELEDQKENADGRMQNQEVTKKKNSFDFTLWKRAKEGEPFFHSPWGKGRPGWHIECSAMAREELGETIDIHLGGCDLIFPHHENEIAQSEVANEKPLANYWLHNGMVNVGGKKMSKSLGNFTTIRDLLDSGISPMTMRLFILQTHYKKPIDFTEDAISAANSGWNGINCSLNLGKIYSKKLGWELKNNQLSSLDEILDEKRMNPLETYYQKFKKAMDDDLNTASALSVLFELSKPLKAIYNKIERQINIDHEDPNIISLFSQWELLSILSKVLGLSAEDIKINYTSSTKIKRIERLISDRQEAKNCSDFEKADKIRNLLSQEGIELIDKGNGITIWKELT